RIAAADGGERLYAGVRSARRAACIAWRPLEMTFTLTRREFVRRLSMVTAVAPLVRHRARAPIVLRIGVVPSASRHALSARARQQGIAMGVDDARRAATL